MGSGSRLAPEAEVPPGGSHFREMNGAADPDGGGGSGCRRRYRALKRRLRLLLYVRAAGRKCGAGPFRGAVTDRPTAAP